jgi:Ca2+-binding EF-hand superfamily protein
LKEWLALTNPGYKIADDAYAKLLFKTFDANKDGLIDFNEYLSIIKTDMANMDRDLDQIQEDFDVIDLNQDGFISLDGKFIHNYYDKFD